MNFSQLNNLNNQSFVIKNMINAASVKILMNYSQTISIINSLNLNWEGKLMEIFNVYKTASGGFQQVVSLECFFSGLTNINKSLYYKK